METQIQVNNKYTLKWYEKVLAVLAIPFYVLIALALLFLIIVLFGFLAIVIGVILIIVVPIVIFIAILQASTRKKKF
jgi:hypothetical protein